MCIVLRNNADILETLFLTMISARMTELSQRKDILYLRNMLHLNSTKDEAEALFDKEIDNAINSTWRSIDNFLHNVKHG